MTDRSRHDLALLEQLGSELCRVERLQRQRRSRPLYRLHVRLRRALRPPAVAIALTVGATGVATATGVVAAPWQPLFGSPHFPEPQPRVTAAKPPSDQLGALAILRRSQTPRDRAAATPALHHFGVSTDGVRSDYIRSVEIPGARQAVLVPAATFRYRIPYGRAVAKQDVVCLFIPDSNRDGGAKGCYTTAEILDGAANVAMGDTYYSLVPDGVARVQANFGSAVSSQTTDNLVSFIARGKVVPVPREVTWIASDGSTLKRSILGSGPLAPAPPAPPPRSSPNAVNAPS